MNKCGNYSKTEPDLMEKIRRANVSMLLGITENERNVLKEGLGCMQAFLDIEKKSDREKLATIHGLEQKLGPVY
jgi:hypothetical protein